MGVEYHPSSSKTALTKSMLSRIRRARKNVPVKGKRAERTIGDDQHRSPSHITSPAKANTEDDTTDNVPPVGTAVSDDFEEAEERARRDPEYSIGTLSVESLGKLGGLTALAYRDDPSMPSRLEPKLLPPAGSGLLTTEGLVYSHGRIYKDFGGPRNLKNITTTQDLSAVKQFAQAIFFHQGDFELDKLPLLNPIDFSALAECSDYDSDKDSWHIEYLLKCGCEGPHSNLCYQFESELGFFRRELTGYLVSRVCDWVTCIVLMTRDRSQLAQKLDRLRYWKQELERENVRAIFEFLSPGVDVDKLLESEACYSWAVKIIVYVADYIVTYHYGNPSQKHWHWDIYSRFWDWIRRERPMFALHNIPLGGHLVVEE